jgi:hypothetical protein
MKLVTQLCSTHRRRSREPHAREKFGVLSSGLFQQQFRKNIHLAPLDGRKC